MKVKIYDLVQGTEGKIEPEFFMEAETVSDNVNLILDRFADWKGQISEAFCKMYKNESKKTIIGSVVETDKDVYITTKESLSWEEFDPKKANEYIDDLYHNKRVVSRFLINIFGCLIPRGYRVVDKEIHPKDVLNKYDEYGLEEYVLHFEDTDLWYVIFPGRTEYRKFTRKKDLEKYIIELKHVQRL